MYILKNALKSITRNKLRNVLIGVIVLIISVSACVSLSIRQAAEASKQDTMNGLSVTAQISFNRQKAMEDMQKPDDSDDSEKKEPPSFDRGKFDFSVLQGSSLTLDEYMTYTEALSDGDGYYYSGAISLDAMGNLLPYGTEEDSDSESSDSSKSTESSQSSDTQIKQNFGFSPENGGPPANFGPGGMMGRMDKSSAAVDYIDSVSSATNLVVILELMAVGLFLTLAAMISIMRYEPLKILSNRT